MAELNFEADETLEDVVEDDDIDEEIEDLSEEPGFFSRRRVSIISFVIVLVLAIGGGLFGLRFFGDNQEATKSMGVSQGVVQTGKDIPQKKKKNEETDVRYETPLRSRSNRKNQKNKYMPSTRWIGDGIEELVCYI